jgi:hypothetical protein
MKQIVVIGILCLSLCHFKAHAQSGYSEGSYYQQVYTVSDVPVGRAYNKYNGYGQIIGVFQMWKYAKWDSTTGGQYVYVWGPNGWESQWYSGTYWWFNWVVYERQIE